MLRLAFDFIITWRETRTRPNAYVSHTWLRVFTQVTLHSHTRKATDVTECRTK